MRTTALVLMLISPAALWQRVWKPTNSYAAARRGQAEYGGGRFQPSIKSFDQSDRLSPSARSAFNLGTAQIAGGRTTAGSATLARAMNDRALRADSLFNRGNSALKSKAYEYAIRDYVDTLRLRPGDAGAKRNLEIALEQMQAQRRAAAGRQGQQQPSPSPQQEQKSSSTGQEDDPQQGNDEALLRSVQQQEQEELQRMKRASGASVRVGW